MDPIEILMAEHRIIESVLSALTNYARAVGAGGTETPQGDLGRFVEFIRQFADRAHHGKEEDILFKVMVENGFPREGGPIAVMLAEHEEGRAHARTLKTLSETSPWSAQDRSRLAATATSFAALLRQHIQKEDTVLYPMARTHLPEEAMREIRERVDRFEQHEKKSGEYDRLRALAKSLTERHG